MTSQYPYAKVTFAFPQLNWNPMKDLPDFDPFLDVNWMDLLGLARVDSTLNKVGPGMFLPLSRQIAQYEAELKRPAPALSKFLQFATAKISDEAYANIQRRHLNRQAIDALVEMLKTAATLGINSPWEKYLNFPAFAVSKFQHAIRLGLHESSALDILDIGAGPGHFAFLCDYFGHRCLALDKELDPYVPGLDRHLYHDLCEIFGVETMTQKVRRGVRLELPHRFDRVTCWMGNFHCEYDFESGPVGKLTDWSADDWRFFLSDLKENVMKEKFELHFQITPMTNAHSLAYLKSLSQAGNPDRYLFVFDETTQF